MFARSMKQTRYNNDTVGIIIRSILSRNRLSAARSNCRSGLPYLMSKLSHVYPNLNGVQLTDPSQHVLSQQLYESSPRAQRHSSHPPHTRSNRELRDAASPQQPDQPSYRNLRSARQGRQYSFKKNQMINAVFGVERKKKGTREVQVRFNINLNSEFSQPAFVHALHITLQIQTFPSMVASQQC